MEIKWKFRARLREKYQGSEAVESEQELELTGEILTTLAESPPLFWLGPSLLKAGGKPQPGFLGWAEALFTQRNQDYSVFYLSIKRFRLEVVWAEER